MAEVTPATLLELLARSLVDEPDQVQVTEVPEGERELVLELEVAEDDLGRVIGRGGRVANALRSVVRASATQSDQRILVDILD
ncbi:MAG: KH domain-containing protein [bacterium]